MQATDEEQGSARRNALVALALIMAVLATRALWFGNPAATTDEQLYALIGAQLADGTLPYLEVWDRKPLGLFAIFAAGDLIAGPPYGFQILAAFFTLLGAWLTYRLALLQVDRIAAIGAGILYTILISLYGGFSGQSEVFHAPLMLLMAWLVLDSSATHFSTRAVFAMLVGGLSLQVKYTVLPQCIFFGLVALWHLYRHGFAWSRLAGMAAIFTFLGLLPTVLVSALYAFAGEFDAFWFANFESFFHRDGAGRLLANTMRGATPLLVLGFAGAYFALRGKPLRNFRIFELCVGWFLASLVSVFLPGTVYLYYFGALVAPIILLALPLLDTSGPLKAAPLALVLAASFWLLGPLADWRTSHSESASLEALAAEIRPLVDEEDACLWVHDGPTALYAITGSCLPSRFAYPDHLNNALETDAALGTSQSAEAARILKQRPPVIVTSKEPLTMQNERVLAALEEALDADYEELGSATSGYREVVAYSLRGIEPE